MTPFAHRLCLSLLLTALLAWPAAADDLVRAGSVWRYLDNGTNQGTAWRGTSFDHSAWATGAAELGYGDGDEETTVSYGPDENDKFVTTYFRHAFDVEDPDAFTGLVLSTLRDDGAVVYLNGVEVWRSDNMPTGTIGYRTYADWALGSPEEETFYDAYFDTSLLVEGQNVLAVEIHQADPASTDISFDLRLQGLTSAIVIRGPYLQMGTPSSLVVRWRTNGATDSRVRYGTSSNDLNVVVDDPALTTEHQVSLTGLTPSTTYYYSVGTTTEILAGDETHTFVTPPPVSTDIPTRVWILGDSGAPNADAIAVRDAYYSYTGTTNTSLWLMLGDNAYEEGTDAEYQAALFDMYPAMLRRSVLWPTLGNHDTAQSSTVTPALPYFAMFSLPTAGEAGGVASGTEKYYSFDYGQIHFVCLDSMTSDRSPTGPMLTWLESDLAATTQKWIIAYWHHPPYSKGSHDSDDETELVQMRVNALPILEDYGVDLVLSGHSHSYERSYLLDSHYGTSSTLISSMIKDGGSGRPEETGAYSKPTSGPAPHEGAVYAVAGTSSVLQQNGTYDHPAMFLSLTVYGSMILDVHGDRLDAKFLRKDGVVADSFTIVKGPSAPPATPAGVSAQAIAADEIRVTWTAVAGAASYEVLRASAGTPLEPIGMTATNVFDDGTVTSGSAYRYAVRALNAAGASADSASDLAVAMIFTDGSLPAGTHVKTVHLTERRAAVNAVRALAILSAYSFNGSTYVRASHITELRNALDEALEVLGDPTGGYTGTPAAGTPIQAVHFREISERVQ